MGVFMGMLNIDTIQVTSEILALISEIDEFKGAWRALGTLAPERLNALRRIATIESIGSSTRIEGSKLTDREVEQLLDNLEIQKLYGKLMLKHQIQYIILLLIWPMFSLIRRSSEKS